MSLIQEFTVADGPRASGKLTPAANGFGDKRCGPQGPRHARNPHKRLEALGARWRKAGEPPWPWKNGAGRALSSMGDGPPPPPLRVGTCIPGALLLIAGGGGGAGQRSRRNPREYAQSCLVCYFERARGVPQDHGPSRPEWLDSGTKGRARRCSGDLTEAADTWSQGLGCPFGRRPGAFLPQGIYAKASEKNTRHGGPMRTPEAMGVGSAGHSIIMPRRRAGHRDLAGPPAWWRRKGKKKRPIGPCH